MIVMTTGSSVLGVTYTLLMSLAFTAYRSFGGPLGFHFSGSNILPLSHHCGEYLVIILFSLLDCQSPDFGYSPTEPVDYFLQASTGLVFAFVGVCLSMNQAVPLRRCYLVNS